MKQLWKGEMMELDFFIYEPVIFLFHFVSVEKNVCSVEFLPMKNNFDIFFKLINKLVSAGVDHFYFTDADIIHEYRTLKINF